MVYLSSSRISRDILECLVLLLQNKNKKFTLCTKAGGKRAPEGKIKPSHKCIAIDLEMKIRMI
jgi:hypothetical protein